jgi:predicted O-linked N-acetylglucosamine transferase (SPINDLY family)
VVADRLCRYVSVAFVGNVVGYLVNRAIERHDRLRFDVAAYSLRPTPPAADTERPQTERWADLGALSWQGAPRPGLRVRAAAAERVLWAEAAQRIAADTPHIAVNLDGWTIGARNEPLAAQPAPIQVRASHKPVPG